ncbi:MAG TPA: sugar-binding transcriptional regulator, partial [Defluviitaleaceae bacterium]|nr:sugar-binding transcriptional regulator [Defluviitaleaceae bacterium]
MRNLSLTLQKIIPEGVLTLERRYEILRAISYFQPVGRRILANHLGI